MANVSDNDKTTNNMSHIPLGMTSINVTIPPLLQPQSFILLSEYEKLKKIIEENDRIIRDLNSKADLLREEQKKNDAIIKELESSNSEYKKRIDELNEEIRLLKEKDATRDDEIKFLKEKDAARDNKTLFEKYVMAIQDYNSCYFIENKINVNAKKQLIQLKRERIGQCHYFDKDYDDPDAMFYVLSEKIRNMPKPIKDEFDSEYPYVLDGLKDLLSNNMLHQLRKPRDDELKYIDKWWKI